MVLEYLSRGEETAFNGQGSNYEYFQGMARGGEVMTRVCHRGRMSQERLGATEFSTNSRRASPQMAGLFLHLERGWEISGRRVP